MTEKVRENRLRRMAERQGFALRRSRRRDPLARDFGVYWIVDDKGEPVTRGTRADGAMEADEVERWLEQPWDSKKRRPR